ncbi:putative class I SAM-dependent methyltransferase [Paratrimastix pyriformis]|uniref:Class I SAM-dependent methyltransferase n=1 Tax=Paratrimastix pyriformis TaxID=342808 RepID=A0ABQ8UQA6_9EUKA|nr:putative class I SAM-dependent methyltransferase [Paratrimastix pyriformis]
MSLRPTPAFWDARYGATEDFVFGTEPNEFLKASAENIPANGPVLCLCEGEGRNACFLAGRGHSVTAIDSSAAGLEKAARLASSRGVNITTQVADLSEYSIKPGSYAGIISIFAHLPPALRRRVHADVVAGLQPGGVLILEAYTPDQIALGTGGPKDPAMTMTLAGLREELQGLNLEVGQELRRDVREGTGHTGVGAVVQVIARRPMAAN